MSVDDDSPKQGDSAQIEVDLGPWAAYVLGRTPQAMGVWHEALGAQLWCGRPAGIESERARLDHEIEDLDKAVGILASFERIDAFKLHEFHLHLRDFVVAYGEMIEIGLTIGLDDAGPNYLPGDEEWNALCHASRPLLIRSDDDLHDWFQLGKSVGELLLDYREGHCDFTGMQKSFETTVALLERLSARIGVRSTRDAIAIATTAFSASPPTDYMIKLIRFERLKWLDIVQLDARISNALKNEAAFEPILVLDREGSTLFGMPIPAEGQRKQIACLWVLAENVRKPVARQEIAERIKSDYSEQGLTSVVSRLRKLLRPLIKKHRKTSGGPPLPSEDMAYIDGERASRPKTGRYTLALHPLQVQITSERPSWM